MNKEVILTELQAQFPGKKIICLPEDDPKEIIVELEKAADDSFSVAVAVIDRSAPHRNPGLVETYVVEAGPIIVHTNGRPVTYNTGEMVDIDGNQEHWAEGNAARVEVTSRPAWSPEHHVLS